MNNVKCKIVLLGIIALLGWMSCDLPWAAGPMPVDIVKTDYEPKLNIFGVVRNDGTAGGSFFHVERNLTTDEIYNQDDSLRLLIDDAVVTLKDSVTGQEYQFTHAVDTLYEGYYYHDTFLPEPGKVYSLTVTAPGFPNVTAQTIVPQFPDIDTTSIIIERNKIKFSLNQSFDSYQYTWHVIYSNGASDGVIRGAADDNLAVSINLDEDLGIPIVLMISGQDENLTSYSNSSLSIIPQTFHEDGSTVTGGYGCFGSVSVVCFDLTSN